MEERNIYTELMKIVEPLHCHGDQMRAITKWIKTEFLHKSNITVKPFGKVIMTEQQQKVDIISLIREGIDKYRHETGVMPNLLIVHYIHSGELQNYCQYSHDCSISENETCSFHGVNVILGLNAKREEVIAV